MMNKSTGRQLYVKSNSTHPHPSFWSFSSPPVPRGQTTSIRRTLTDKSSHDSIKTQVSSNLSSSQVSKNETFLQRWLAHKDIPPRGTLKWYGEMVLICTVFAITGTSTMVIVRPAVSNVLGLEGSLKDGPWSYRICSLVIMTPLYSAMLVVVGVSVHSLHRSCFARIFINLLSFLTPRTKHCRPSLGGIPTFDILQSRCFHVLGYPLNSWIKIFTKQPRTLGNINVIMPHAYDIYTCLKL